MRQPVCGEAATKDDDGHAKIGVRRRDGGSRVVTALSLMCVRGMRRPRILFAERTTSSLSQGFQKDTGLLPHASHPQRDKTRGLRAIAPPPVRPPRAIWAVWAGESVFVSATMPVLGQWQGLPSSRTGRLFVAADHKVECNVEATKR
jgi:hypothetical protein